MFVQDMPSNAAGNAGWRLQFVEKSLVGGCHHARVPEPERWAHYELL